MLGDITNVVNSQQENNGNFNESISPISEYSSEKINYDSSNTVTLSIDSSPNEE